MYNYIGVLHKSSAVSHSLKCNFLNSESKMNLIVSKTNIIEIYNLTKEGIEPTPYINIYGTVILLEAIQSGRDTQDNLFVLTEDLDYSIIGAEKNQIVNYAKGSIKEDIGKKQDSVLYAIDNKLQIIIISAYKNIFKVVSLSTNLKDKHANLSLRYHYDDLLFLFPFFIGKQTKTKPIGNEIFSINFGVIKTSLPPPSNNQINNNSNSLMNTNNQANQLALVSLETFKVNMTKGEINKLNSFTHDFSFNPTMSMTISSPLGIFVLFFSNYVVWYQIETSILIERNKITYSDRKFITYTQIEPHKYFVSDEYGNLFLLAFKTISDSKYEMIFQFLGEINYSSKLSYLDNNYLFVASQKSNSQLVKVLTSPRNSLQMPFIEIIEEYESLAPISDFTIINNSKDINSIEIISVSGTDKKCSLKNLRKGTSLIIEGELKLEGITNIFKISYYNDNSMIEDDVVDINNSLNNKRTLLITSLGKTSLFFYFSYLDNYTLSIFNKIELDINEKVLYANNIFNDNIIIITNRKRSLYDCYLNLICEKTFESSMSTPLIIKYHNKTGRLFIFFSSLMLIRFECNTTDNFLNAQPMVIASNINVSAFDISEHYIIYSLWNRNNIFILSFGLNKVNILCNIEENESVLISSIQMIKKDGIKFVFMSLSNGKMIYYKLKIQFRNWPNYNMSSNDFVFKRKYNISTENFEIKKNKNDKTSCLFLNTQIPSLIYINKENPVFSNFNVKCCSEIISLDYNLNTYLFTFTDRIAFGSLLNNQSQSVLSKQFNNQIYSLTQIYFGKDLPFLGMIIEEKKKDIVNSFFAIYGLNFHEIARYKLDYDYEISTSLTELNISDRKIFAIGTGICENVSIEPSIGHIYLLEITDGFKIKKISEVETNGGVYKIAAYNNIIFVAIGPTLYFYHYEIELKLIRKWVLFTLINDISFFNNELVISDVYRSIAVFSYDIEKEKLNEICRDYNPVWVYSVSQCNDNMLYLSDIDGNIISAKKELHSKSDEEKYKLERKALFNYGERINKMYVTKLRGKELKDISLLDNADELNVTYFGTLEGSIGIIIQLTKDTYEFLCVLQSEILKKIVPTGNFEYNKWRSFKDGFITEPSNGFIEGAVLQEFLNFEENYRREFLKELNYPWPKNVGDIINIIEMLLKYH